MGILSCCTIHITGSSEFRHIRMDVFYVNDKIYLLTYVLLADLLTYLLTYLLTFVG